MNWISVKDRLPTAYAYYLVCKIAPCDMCDDGDNEHWHRLNFERKKFGLAYWKKADTEFVAYYQARGDDKWDRFGVDHWCGNDIADSEITHWMTFDNHVPGE